MLREMITAFVASVPTAIRGGSASVNGGTTCCVSSVSKVTKTATIAAVTTTTTARTSTASVTTDTSAHKRWKASAASAVPLDRDGLRKASRGIGNDEAIGTGSPSRAYSTATTATRFNSTHEVQQVQVDFLDDVPQHIKTKAEIEVKDEEDSEPLLLLEGDEFYVSHDGIARTLYQLVGDDRSGKVQGAVDGHRPAPVTVEELYDLGSATKTFVLRREDKDYATGSDLLRGRPGENGGDSKNENPVNVDFLTRQAAGVAPLGRPLTCLELQEVDHGPTPMFQSEAGTGGTTWEASIAMALHFHNHPDELRGNVIELGCGVGAGGLLTHWGLPAAALAECGESATAMSGHLPHVDSVTLTDGNQRVLRQCRQNIGAAYKSMKKREGYLGDLAKRAGDSLPPISVERLDWNELVASSDSMKKGGDRSDGGGDCRSTNDSLKRKRGQKTYDTVIACDCAYRYSDVPVLSEAMRALLTRTDEPSNGGAGAKIHMFGPCDRAAFQEVCRHLKEEGDMDVVLELIEIDRYRLKPAKKSWSQAKTMKSSTSVEDAAFASKCTGKFIHMTASAKKAKSPDGSTATSLADID